MKKPKPTAALASETVVIRAVRPSRWREIVVLIAALLLVAGVALWVFK